MIKKKGGNAVFVKTDVSVAKDNENMVKVAESTFGKLNVMFLNAGCQMEYSNFMNSFQFQESCTKMMTML